MKLRAKPASVDAGALRHTVLLFRSFGEDYHEKKLEETQIFPAIKRASGPAAAYVDTLIDNCQRGRLELATLNLWRAPRTASS